MLAAEREENTKPGEQQPTVSHPELKAFEIQRHPTCYKTITADNAREFHGYRDIEDAHDV
jgi:hypothetical protein